MRLIREDAGLGGTHLSNMIGLYETQMKENHFTCMAQQSTDPDRLKRANAWIDWKQTKDFLNTAMESMLLPCPR